MSDVQRTRWSLVAFPLAGIVSALSAIYMYPYDYPYMRYLIYGNVLGSGVFGVLLAAACWLSFGLRSLWKTAGFIVASVGAAYLGLFSAVASKGKLFLPGPPYEQYDPVFFVGGFLGALALVVAALFLLSPRPRIRSVVLTGLLSSLAGGILGIVGAGSGDLFDRLRSRLGFMHFQVPYSDVSLIILVWQTGMSLVLALALWSERRRSQTG